MLVRDGSPGTGATSVVRVTEGADDNAATRITLVTRQACHLCDDARQVVAAVARRTGAGWTEVDVDDDPELLRTYSEQVPVVLVDGARHAYWRVDAAQLEAALAGGPRHRSRWLRRRP